MPDIELRFFNDMLVLSAPIDATLARQGTNVARDRQYLNLMEPDVITDALRLEAMAGAQCLVTTTEDITRARLAHVRMEDDSAALAHAAVQALTELKPQHILAEIGPCGLPLDEASKASLNENRGQYADAARTFLDEPVDALFLNGFTNLGDLKCALMGVAQVCDKPIFASVIVGKTPPQEDAASLANTPGKTGAGSGAKGHLTSDEQVLDSIAPAASFIGYELVDTSDFPDMRANQKPLACEQLAEAMALMQEFGAAVAGFETADLVPRAVAYAKEAAQACSLPILAQLRVTTDLSERKPAPLVPLEDRADYTPDTLASAAVKLYGAGVQFLRATGNATPACTGALAAAVHGLSVRR